MNLENIIFCEDVIDLPTSAKGIVKPAVVSPTASFILEVLPSTFSFSALIMLKGLPLEPANLKISFMNPRTDRLLFEAAAEINTSIQVNPSVPKEIAGINLNLPLKNVFIEDEGEYVLKVEADSFKEEKKLYFVKAG
ncbi:hypothetical protein NQU17_02580 [Clostridiaceae bacterium HFYG-1003]|nr:hypothetical protein NQU17_08140 [Clostridiaceae bacterium HFYG-1003]UUM12469.1 hypothetical protein NQU17_02580 [Clostridiaceae bacterium HFYG-1003]